jgi:TRAP-type C4-dicarboxylate transport system permease small subunit
MRQFVQVSDTLSRICGIIAMSFMAMSIVVVTQMVFVRYVLSHSTIWQTEFVIYAVIASTFIGAPYVLLHKGHVAVDLLPNMLMGRAKVLVDGIAALISLAFCALLAYSAWHFFYEALSKGWKTETVWAIPLWIPLLPLPLGVGILCLQYIAELWKTANGFDDEGRAV